MKNILLIICFFLCSTAFSQKNGPPPGSPREELLKVKMQKFMDALQTDSSTAIKYFTSSFENRKAINQLSKQRKNLMEDIESDLDAADLGSKLEQLEGIEFSIYDLRKTFFNELKTYLTSKQIAQAMLLEKKFGKRLKEELDKRKNKFDDDNPNE
ncbi:hypothetical protein BH10BAC5_BH10BAC5_03980 [soil metagenome]